ncbi:MAG: diguanylate cyclase [Ruminococcaceae bacterium]|nr:diguanylate cyclase [Oscillospiraceae bacterium]
MQLLSIQTLGEFSLQYGENKVSDRDNRSKKSWLLLAYLLCNKDRPVSQKKLIELLWGDDPASSNPENALKITFHRTRTMLDKLWPNAGRELIVHRDAGYAWNGEVPCTLDMEEFDRLGNVQTEDEEARIASYLQALSLYQGDFLEKLSSETWVIPITTHYHNRYIELVMELVPLLMQRERFAEAAQICRAAVGVEPYHEPLHAMLIRALGACGDQKAAVAAYEDLTKKLFDDFGILPSEEIRQAYREATRSLNDQSLPMEQVLEHLQEQDPASGALQCEYDYFKVLCFVEARAMERSGKATHIALLSITAALDSKPLSKRSMNTALEHLQDEIRTNLRRGDTFARCSGSQFIVMLPQANYENSCMVCRRIIGAYTRKYPHSPVKLHFMVQPLTPSISVP